MSWRHYRAEKYKYIYFHRAQARKLTDRQVQLFSGEEFNVDQERGLNGFCDFLFTKSTNRFSIEAPVLMLVEAKRGEIESGWGQCVAEMVAAQLYNQNQRQSISVIYGCVTSGRLWQFFVSVPGVKKLAG